MITKDQYQAAKEAKEAAEAVMKAYEKTIPWEAWIKLSPDELLMGCRTDRPFDPLSDKQKAEGWKIIRVRQVFETDTP